MDARRSGRRKSKKNNHLDVHKLSKGQKKHLKEFGELHPIDDTDFDTVDKTSNVKRKRIESIIDESLNSRQKKKSKPKVIDDDIENVQRPAEIDEGDELDNEDEISPYEQLVCSLSEQQTKKQQKLKKRPQNELRLEENEGLDDNEVDLEVDLDHMNDDIDSDNDTELSINGQTSDPFSIHFENDLDDSIVKKLEKSGNCSGKPVKTLLKSGVVSYYPPIPEIDYPVETTHSDILEKVWVKERLCKRWRQIKNTNNDELFTSLQQEIFPIINSYQDCFYTGRNFTNADQIREIYCLHALNHILKTRSRILNNNAKIVQCQKDSKELESDLRDQGLTRPKVLILVPFRNSALEIVQILLKLLAVPGEGQVMNRKRFLEEFGSEDSEDIAQKKPDDFKQTFAGNIDDFFRVGLVVMRKSVKLFTEFYSSDIIIASPVGLRAIIGAEGENKRDYDFLSSIEVLIMDQTDIFLMQNWEHIHHIFDHLHIQPKDSHEVDFSRVRMWNLNGWSKFYRQTIIFSGFMSPEINFVFNKYCYNFCGKTKVLSANNTAGTICQVATQMPQAFQKIIASCHKDVSEKRFEYFTNKIFPELKDATAFMSHTAIFVSSYFDFVRIRNYLKKQEVDFFQLSEYTTRANISRSRIGFLQGQKPILLFTERFYFYYRYQIRGIKNIFFYELPYYSQFYTEIVNYMDNSSLQVGSDQTSSCNATILYTKFDCHKLSRIVGVQRCKQMLNSEQTVHMFVTGD